MKKIIFILICSAVLFGFFTSVTMAAFPTLVPAECASSSVAESKKCDLSKVEQLMVNLAQIILGVAGSVALLMLIIGGVMYLTSGGTQARVQKGTKIITSAIIGLIIIFAAGFVVRFLVGTLAGEGLPSAEKPAKEAPKVLPKDEPEEVEEDLGAFEDIF